MRSGWGVDGWLAETREDCSWRPRPEQVTLSPHSPSESCSQLLPELGATQLLNCVFALNTGFVTVSECL